MVILVGVASFHTKMAMVGSGIRNAIDSLHALIHGNDIDTTANATKSADAVGMFFIRESRVPTSVPVKQGACGTNIHTSTTGNALAVDEEIIGSDNQLTFHPSILHAINELPLHLLAGIETISACDARIRTETKVRMAGLNR